MNNVLLVFAKAPVAGRVKTRLTALLSEDEAAALYQAFLQDALAQYATLGADVRLCVAPPAEAFPQALVPEGVMLREQAGSGLGARMKNALRDAFASGYARAVVIGTDHPTLPPRFVEKAFTALEEPPAVSIGPSVDGGYYLLGMSALFPQLFDGMAYSHAGVFEETRRRIGKTPARCTVLPRWYDVDTPAALIRLVRDLACSRGEAPRTRAVVARLRAAHPQLQKAPEEFTTLS